MSRQKGLGKARRLTREELLAMPHIRFVYDRLCGNWGTAVGERYLKVMAKPVKAGGGASFNYPSALKEGVEA